MWDFFDISIQGWHICDSCLTTTNSWMNPNLWILSQKKRPEATRQWWYRKVLIQKQEILQHSQNTAKGLRPRINMPWPRFLPQTRTSTIVKIKNVPRILRNLRTAVRNIARTHHLIIASMEKKSHNLREWKVLNTRSADKDKYKYGKKDCNKKFKELNLFQA